MTYTPVPDNPLADALIAITAACLNGATSQNERSCSCVSPPSPR